VTISTGFTTVAGNLVISLFTIQALVSLQKLEIIKKDATVARADTVLLKSNRNEKYVLLLFITIIIHKLCRTLFLTVFDRVYIPAMHVYWQTKLP